jgi:hypothetical protein
MSAAVYRIKAAEFRRLAREASFISDIKTFLRRADAFAALAESEGLLERDPERTLPKA